MKPLVSDPLVTLNAEGEWSAEHDVLIRYSAGPEFPSSAWDWIGLFQVLLPHPASSPEVGMGLQELVGSCRALILATAELSEIVVLDCH